jgi:hypothetical protein
MSETPKPANVLVTAVGTGVLLVYLRGGFDKVTSWSEVILALVIGGGSLALISWLLAGWLLRLGRWLRPPNRDL